MKILTTYVCSALVLAINLMLLLPTLSFAEEDVATSTSKNIEETRPYLYQKESITGGVVGDFVVGPGKVELTINPGESKTILISVSNRTGESRRFQIEVEDAKGSKDVSQTVVLLGNDRGPYTMKDFISVPSKTFELEHGKRARIPVTISVPQGADPGGRYGSVLFKTVAVPGASGGPGAAQSPIEARIGTLFFITIPGPTNVGGEVSDFKTIPNKVWFKDGPVNFGITFENTGDIHLAPYGELRITNMFDEEVGFVEIEPWFVLPQAFRLREITWNREALFGKYTATLKINRSYDNVIDNKELTFYVIPVKVIVGTFVSLFFLFFIIRYISKNFEFKRKV